VIQLTGTVKRFNGEKGYGFITRDDGEKAVFVHCSAIEDMSGFRSPAESLRVQLEVERGTKGPSALRLRPI
jgi:CspA family cold shock protein